MKGRRWARWDTITRQRFGCDCLLIFRNPLFNAATSLYALHVHFPTFVFFLLLWLLLDISSYSFWYRPPVHRRCLTTKLDTPLLRQPFNPTHNFDESKANSRTFFRFALSECNILWFITFPSDVITHYAIQSTQNKSGENVTSVSNWACQLRCGVMGGGGQYKGAEIDEKTKCLQHIVWKEYIKRQRKTVYAM